MQFQLQVNDHYNRIDMSIKLCLDIIRSSFSDILLTYQFDCNGHSLVAEIALNHMSEAKKTAVKSLIQKFGKQGFNSFPRAACYLDAVKGDY
jgi:hypothetical protein